MICIPVDTRPTIIKIALKYVIRKYKGFSSKYKFKPTDLKSLDALLKKLEAIK
jgi:hypothetical protein